MLQCTHIVTRMLVLASSEQSVVGISLCSERLSGEIAMLATHRRSAGCTDMNHCYKCAREDARMLLCHRSVDSVYIDLIL